MINPIHNVDNILNQILDKITANGFKSLSENELHILDRISKGEALLTMDTNVVNIKPNDTPIDRFNKAIKHSGYDKDFRKIYGSNFTTRGRVTGWFIENDFIAYLEYEDKRVDAIYDNIANKSTIPEFNEMISNIIIHIEHEFKIEYTNDELKIEVLSKKYKLNHSNVEFILYK
jgi:hypothetical protein